MFADNWKISLRQIKRLLILDIFGLSSLMLPRILSSMTGADGIFCLLFGMLGGILLVWLMQKNLKNIRGNYYNYMIDATGQIVGDIFMVFYFLYFVTLCSFVLYQTTNLVLTWLLPEGSYVWVSLLLLLLATYGTIRGIEGRARVYEIIFWFLGIPLLVMLFLALREVRVDYWTPIVSSTGENLFHGTIAFFIFLKFFICFVKKQEITIPHFFFNRDLRFFHYVPAYAKYRQNAQRCDTSTDTPPSSFVQRFAISKPPVISLPLPNTYKLGLFHKDRNDPHHIVLLR